MTLPKLALIPSGYKASKVYSALPTNGDGNFTFSRTSNATRVNKNGLIETVDSNVPRLDYSDSNCPSLLLEPQRTNLILFSEAFTGTNWFSTNTTLTPNNIISPSGELNGNKLERTSTSGSYRQHLISKAASAITYTTSIFIKKGSDNYFAMRAQGSYPNRVDIRFRFDTEEIYYATAFSAFVLLDYGVESYGNGWYRIHFTYTTDTHTYLQNLFIPRATDGNTDSTDTSNNSYAYVWGLQVEEGSYQTSYIPTEGSTVTRVTETCNGAGNAQVFNDSEGVLFADISALANDLTNRNIALSDNTTNNRIVIVYTNTSNQIRFYLQGSGGTITINHTLTDETDFVKVAIKYKAQDFSFYVNGVEVDTNTSNITFSGLNDLSFYNPFGGGTSPFYGNVKSVAVFNEALTDQELIALTT